MSFLLKLLWAVLLLCVLVLATATIGLTYYKDEIESKIAGIVSDATGRELQIQNGFGFRFSPHPSVYARDIALANAKWGTQPWMLKIKEAQVSFSVLALAQGKLKISDIRLDSPYFLFERRDGQLNWRLDERQKGQARPLEILNKRLLLHHVVIENAQFDIQVNPNHHLINLDRVAARVNPIDQDIDVDITGSLKDKAILAQGTLTDINSILLRQPTEIELSGSLGDMPLSAKGSVADVLRWQGIESDIEAQAPSLQFFQTWNLNKLPNTPAIYSRARFVQPEGWHSAKLEDIQLRMPGYGGVTTMQGRFGNLGGWDGLNLAGTATHQTQPILKQMGFDAEEDALINADFTLSGHVFDGLRLELVQATLLGQGVSAQAQGAIDNLRSADTSGLEITAQAQSLDRVGQLLGRAWPITQAIKASTELAKVSGTYGLQALSASAYDDQVKITGELANIGPNAVGRFSVQGALTQAQIKIFNEDNNIKLPLATEISWNSAIKYAAKSFSSDDTQAQLNFGDTVVIATGRVDDFASMAVQADMRIDAPTVTGINAAYKLSLPQLGRLQASAQLRGSRSSQYDIYDVIGDIKNKHHNIDIKGYISDLGIDLKTNLRLALSADSFAGFQPSLNFALPKKTAASGQLKLTSQSLDNWSLTNVKINLRPPAKGKITGAIHQFPARTRYDLNIAASNLNAAKIPQLDGIEFLKKKNIDFKGHLSSAPGAAILKAQNLDITIRRPGSQTQLSAIGYVENIATMGGLNLIGQLQGDDLASISGLANLSLKTNLPFNANFQILRHGAKKELQLNIVNAKIAQSDLAGSLTYRLAKNAADLPYISGALTSNKLDILSLLVKKERTRMFSDKPIPSDWAGILNANISLSVAELNGSIANIKKAQTRIKLENGIFTLPGLTGQVGGGDLTFWLALDTTAKPYNMISSMAGTGLDSQAFNLFGDSGLIRRGLIDVDLGVSGAGYSLAEMMGNAYGKLQFQLINASLKNENLELFGADLILGLLDILNPFSKQEKYLDIECGVIHFPINKGRAYADQGIAIKTDRVTVLGGGVINLKDETLQILIKPKARKGLGLSAGTIAQIARIGGSIGKPKVEVSTSGIFTAAASIGAAVASGGITLLAQGLFDRNKANSDVCAQTLSTPIFARSAQNVNSSSPKASKSESSK